MDRVDDRISSFLKECNISLAQAIEMMENYFSKPTKEKTEEVDLMNLDFWIGREHQHLYFLRTINLYL